MLNGIDTQEWNPETDKKIYQRYSAKSLKKGKAANKLALQKELGLAERTDVRKHLLCAYQHTYAVCTVD